MAEPIHVSEVVRAASPRNVRIMISAAANSLAKLVLNLEEVTIVDLEVIRFLQLCEDKGVRIVHCSTYIREWIRRERASN